MTDTPTWTAPPPSLSLETGEIHVWRIVLEQPEIVLKRLRSTLQPDEIDRANRFHFEKHRRHFEAGRGLLRELLARYLETEPGALRFTYGAYGKPALEGLRFNMSHSHEVALLAVAREAELGVDVEHIRADFA